MRSDVKENLEKLTKEQLIYIIDRFDHLYTMIGETCVSESKCHIDPDEAINKIRKYCCNIHYDIDIANENIGDYINMKLGKISKNEFDSLITLTELIKDYYGKKDVK